jgi:hypothetical protein
MLVCRLKCLNEGAAIHHFQNGDLLGTKKIRSHENYKPREYRGKSNEANQHPGGTSEEPSFPVECGLTVSADLVLVSTEKKRTGRKPNVEDLGLEHLKVETTPIHPSRRMFAVQSKLFSNRKKHFHYTEGQHAFGVGGGFTAAELGGVGEEFYSSWAAFSAPKPTAMQELFPLTLTGLFQKLRCGEALQKQPGRGGTPVFEGFQSYRIVLC